MVVARTKLMIEDDILRPDPHVLRAHFSGNKPERFYKEIAMLIPKIYHARGGEVQEVGFSWDNVGDTQKFKVRWQIMRFLDRFSYYFFTIDLEGKSIKGIGDVDIELDGCLRTEYAQDTMWQKSLFYEIMRMFWHRIFYNTKRMKYLEEGKTMMRSFENEVKLLFEKFKEG